MMMFIDAVNPASGMENGCGKRLTSVFCYFKMVLESEGQPIDGGDKRR